MRVVLHWPSVGPYHLARARGVLSMASEPTELVILATAGQVEDRPWSAAELPPGVRLEVAFPGRNYPTLSAAEMKTRLVEMLDEWRPEVIGVAGYGMTDSREVLRWARRHGVSRILMSETKADDAPRKWYKELAKRYYVRQFGAALCGGTPHRRYLETLGMPAERIFDKYDVVDNGHFARECAKWRTTGPRDDGTERPEAAVKGGGAAEGCGGSVDQCFSKPVSEGAGGGETGGDRRSEVGDQMTTEAQRAGMQWRRPQATWVAKQPKVERTAGPYFLASSRFIERKNLRRLIDAYADYRRRSLDSSLATRHPSLPTWGLVLLGTGPLREEMMRQVERERIPEVSFPGFQQLDALLGYYAGAGAFVHPARQEQWGLVVNEAMACGLPVLVSRTVGAAYDLVQDGVNGFRFDPEDTGGLAALLTKVAAPDFPREQFGAASRRIIAEWTPEEFGRNFWRAAAVAAREVK